MALNGFNNDLDHPVGDTDDVDDSEAVQAEQQRRSVVHARDLLSVVEDSQHAEATSLTHASTPRSSTENRVTSVGSLVLAELRVESAGQYAGAASGRVLGAHRSWPDSARATALLPDADGAGHAGGAHGRADGSPRRTVEAEYRIPENDPSTCATWNPPRTSYSAHNPTLTPHIAFSTWHSGGLQAVSVQNARRPIQAGSVHSGPT